MMRSVLAALALIPAAVQAVRSENADGKERVYANKHLRIRFAVPEDGYDLRTRGFKYGWNNTLVEVVDKDGQVSGVLAYSKTGKKAAEIEADNEKWIRGTKDVRDFEVVQEKKLDRAEGEWVLREYRYTFKDWEWHVVRVTCVTKKSAFEFVTWTAEEHWEERKDEMFRIVNSLELGEPEQKKAKKVDEDPERP